jgi:hypothetical protein
VSDPTDQAERSEFEARYEQYQAERAAAELNAAPNETDQAPDNQAPDQAAGQDQTPSVPEVGAAVTFSYPDHRAMTPDNPEGTVTRFGVVMALSDTHADGSDRRDEDGNPAPAAVVAWFPEVSDPIPVSGLEW